MEEEEKQEELKEKREARFQWFDNVPLLYKLLVLGIIIVKYMDIQSKGGNLGQIWIWVLVGFVILYLIGTEGRKRNTSILTPEEAEQALLDEINRKKRTGNITRWTKVFIGPNNGLFHHEGMPVHYQIGIEWFEDDVRVYKRGIVMAEGLEKGIATIQDSPGRLTGREPIPVATPKLFKTLKKYDVDMDKFIFGGQSK